MLKYTNNIGKSTDTSKTTLATHKKYWQIMFLSETCFKYRSQTQTPIKRTFNNFA